MPKQIPSTRPSRAVSAVERRGEEKRGQNVGLVEGGFAGDPTSLILRPIRLTGPYGARTNPGRFGVRTSQGGRRAFRPPSTPNVPGMRSALEVYGRALSDGGGLRLLDGS